MALSSLGIASGIDESVITQLVALEKKPLQTLQTKATAVNSQISTYARIKSLMSTLSDAANKLGQSATWNSKVATSSSSAVSATVTSAAQGASYDIGVSQLAQAQSTSSSAVPKDTKLGAGTLSIRLGTWSGAAGSEQFAAGSASAVSVEVKDTDTLSDIASKINKANSGVTASVLRDASGERLLFRSSATGESTGFRVQSSDSALSSLAFDPESAPGQGMAANAVQYGKNAQATINGISVSSTTNAFTDTLPGLSFTVSQVTTTTGPAVVTVSTDTDALKKGVQDFVTAYNALNDLLGSSTKYDEASKTAGALQGDSTTVGLQNALRSVVASSTAGGAFARLADIGVDIQKGGKMVINDTKLTAALKNPSALQAMFAGGEGVEGLGTKVRSFATKALGVEGTIENKTNALNSAVKRNSDEQDRVNDRASRVEKQLREKYQALDTKMASLTALNSYIGQQVTMWNKS